MIKRIHAAEHGNWQIRIASGTIHRFEDSAYGSSLNRYVQITATTPECHHLPVFDDEPPVKHLNDPDGS